MPLDTTRVIPTGWSQHHRPVVITSMNATCRVTDPARSTPAGPLDEETGTAPAATPYVIVESTACRIQQLSTSDAALLLGGLKDQQHAYRVSLPDTVTDVQVDYLIDQIDAPNDPLLSSVTLRVRQVLKGSELFDRHVICTENQG